MLEVEAKQKVCHVKLANNADDKYMGYCEGSLCMAWQWKPDAIATGQCGLVKQENYK